MAKLGKVPGEGGLYVFKAQQGCDTILSAVNKQYYLIMLMGAIEPFPLKIVGAGMLMPHLLESLRSI